jgi:hypothetical protein
MGSECPSPRFVGQGATEYLVLLAVVLIVALVSVALLGFFPGMSSDAKITQSQAYWSGQASPFRVKDFAFTTPSAGIIAACSGQDRTEAYELIIENSGIERYTITNISISIGDMPCCTIQAPVEGRLAQKQKSSQNPCN